MVVTDKKVVLLGRTGAGKSTIANALVTGGITDVKFESSDDAVGCTCAIKKETGRGWTVTDTPGLGEAETGSIHVSHTKLRDMLTEFLKQVKDEYSHIIYVQKATRITEMDELIWSIFAKTFEGAEAAFVVLFTAADKELLRVNLEKVPAYLRYQKILVTDIPPISRRPVTEKRQRAIRESSIKTLEAELVDLFAQRGNVCSTPNIVRMSDEELEAKSWSLRKYIVETIKRLFNDTDWSSVVSKLLKLVNVVDLILNVVSAAGG